MKHRIDANRTARAPSGFDDIRVFDTTRAIIDAANDTATDAAADTSTDAANTAADAPSENSTDADGATDTDAVTHATFCSLNGI